VPGTVPFNKEATRWLEVRLVSQLTLKGHHAIRLKNRKNAMAPLCRLAGQMVLTPANRRKVMTACIQSVAMFSSELWWKGDQTQGAVKRANELQLLINQEARATTGCFWTTNLEALSIESGLRPAVAQLENRQRRLGLRLLSLPQGGQVREIVGPKSGRAETHECSHILGQGGEHCFARGSRDLRRGVLKEEEAEAKVEAEKSWMGRDWTTEPPDMRWCGGMAKPGWASKPTWATTRKHMTRMAPLSTGPWRLL